jgi:hypothetical protein
MILNSDHPLSPCVSAARALAVATVWLVAACATPAPPPVPAAPDTTPTVPTAVLESYVVSEGLAGFLPFEGTTTTLTRADMRREDSTVKGTGTVTRYLVGTHDDTHITRLDRKLVWKLYPHDATYTECPLAGCATPGKPERPEQPQAQQPSASKDDSCKFRVASNTFDVKSTGARKAINGFDTEQYTAEWVVVLEDAARRQSTSRLSAEFWTTPLTPAMREAQALEIAYARSSLTAATGLLPTDIVKSMSMFLDRSLSAADKASLFNLGRQFEKIKGHPILTTFRWGFKGNACGGSDTGADAGGGGGSAGGVGGALGVIGGLLGGGKSSGGAEADRPLLSMSHEVRRYRVEPVHESQFVPPPSFRRTN